MHKRSLISACTSMGSAGTTPLYDALDKKDLVLAELIIDRLFTKGAPQAPPYDINWGMSSWSEREYSHLYKLLNLYEEVMGGSDKSAQAGR
jgi:hypothetical protein